MENTSTGNITREIIEKSRLEINNPDFDALIMNTIAQEATKKTLIPKFILYSVLILSIEALIFFMIRALNVNFSVLTSSINSLPENIFFYLDKMTGWIMTNGYFILPVIVILIIKSIVDSKLKFS